MGIWNLRVVEVGLIGIGKDDGGASPHFGENTRIDWRPGCDRQCRLGSHWRHNEGDTFSKHGISATHTSCLVEEVPTRQLASDHFHRVRFLTYYAPVPIRWAKS